MNGLFDDVNAVHHLFLRDDQRRGKPEHNVLNIKRLTKINILNLIISP